MGLWPESFTHPAMCLPHTPGALPMPAQWKLFLDRLLLSCWYWIKKDGGNWTLVGKLVLTGLRRGPPTSDFPLSLCLFHDPETPPLLLLPVIAMLQDDTCSHMSYTLGRVWFCNDKYKEVLITLNSAMKYCRCSPKHSKKGCRHNIYLKHVSAAPPPKNNGNCSYGCWEL